MSGFAPISQDLSYWQKQVKPLFPDLTWNIPEQKTGNVSVVGGNAQSFANVVRTAEFLANHFPIKHVTTILPEVLRSKVPSSENINFATATTSGAFAKSYTLDHAFSTADAVLLAGDLSRNAETAIAISAAINNSESPLVITRDAIDLIAPTAGQILNRPQLTIIGSMVQLQKVLRGAYYPRMITLTQPLVPLIETLHKFTLSYPVTVLTFHQEQVVVAHGGKVSTTNIAATNYSPISLWSGQLAARITALNLFNPYKSFEATTAAVLLDQ